MATPASFDDALLAPQVLLEETGAEGLQVAVHDATRIAWNATVPLPDRGRSSYELVLELEMPSKLAGSGDPWGALQSYARLDVGYSTEEIAAAADESSGDMERFRRDVVAVSVKLARARDGFVRHCTSIRASAVVEPNHAKALALWIDAARGVLAQGRQALLRRERSGRPTGGEDERSLADEFLSAQLWAILTDCARSLSETQRALADRPDAETALLDDVEAMLAGALAEEITYRRAAEFRLAEPVSPAQLGKLVLRMRWLKKHFERVLFLETESYEVATRVGGWVSALMAALAYLWFFSWQIALAHGPAAVGSGLVLLAVLTAVAYASRERLKEMGRNWIAGRVQRLFAQRVTRHRLPGRTHRKGEAVIVARESFSQSTLARPDPGDSTHPADEAAVLRFVQRGWAIPPAGSDASAARLVRLVFRYDLSAILPRLHDAVRGFATPEPDGRRVHVVDVPRDYELPLRAVLRRHGLPDARVSGMLVLSKNGLRRFEEAC